MDRQRPADAAARLSSFKDILLEEVAAEGIPAAGVVDIEPALPLLAPHIAQYDRWLSAGHAGEMQYLVRGRDRRADPRVVMPGAQSMLCVLVPYTRRPLGSLDGGPRYARYLQGRDYHKVIPERLERVMERVRARVEPGLEWKVCVDTSAVLERSWASLAGLGWIGKNTLLIHPRLGSYNFIAEVLLNRETGVGPVEAKDLCGHCDRCLTACPTKAFSEARWLDSRRCISYRTLEHRGPFPDDGLSHGPWVAGCDVCQEVCPFNVKAARESVEETSPDATGLADWAGLERETEEEYRARAAQSSLKRVKPEQFRRNLSRN